AQWYGGSTRDIALVLGLLNAAPAVGGVLSAVLSGHLGRVRWQGRAIVSSMVVWGLAIAAFGFVRWLPIALILLALAGAAENIAAVFRSTMLQAATPDEFRGRVQGILISVVGGSPRLGDVRAGAAAAAFGETA